MNVFDPYTFELLKKLLEKKVEFLIVGGYAVNYHGFRRTTGDIDIWIKPDNNLNKRFIIESLEELEVEEEKLKKLVELDFSKPLVFIDGEEPFKIDFMTYISNVKFEEAWGNKIIADLEGLKIPFINYKELVISKFSTGRLQDKIDIETLQKIRQIKDK